MLGKCYTTTRESSWTLEMDACAVENVYGSSYRLHVLSAVGPQTTVKAVAAILQDSATQQITIDCPPLNAITYCAERYNVHRHRLGFDQWHMLALAADPHLMPSYSQRALWEQISSTRFTTPVLRDWTPWIAAELLRRDRLQRLECWRCDSALLMLDTEELDEIVSLGLRTRKLTMKEGNDDGKP